MRMRFRVKLFLAFFAVSVLICSVVLWLVFREVHGLPTRTVRAMLLSAVANASEAISAEDVESLRESFQAARRQASREQPNLPFPQTDAGQAYLASEEYQRIYSLLRTIDINPPHFGEEIPGKPFGEAFRREINERGFEKDIYVMIRKGTSATATILVSIAPEDSGLVYDMAPYPAMLLGWNEVSAEADITIDEFGRSLGAWAPIRDASGQTVAMLGIDAPAKPIELFENGVTLIIIVLLLIGIAVAILPAGYFSWKLNAPLRQLRDGMERMRSGTEDPRISPVPASGDEFQTLITYFNDTVDALEERDQLRQSLELAKEIQQHLLPMQLPDMPGLDISGHIDYCDETGGDYYDFIEIVDAIPPRFSVAVGDVTGHGIGSALLMASARSILRSLSPTFGPDLPGLIAETNHQLVRDTGDSRFFTLLLLQIDLQSRQFRYISAGHDPALWYHAGSAEVESLGNTGIPLGIMDEATFDLRDDMAVQEGDVLVISTDGVREARNAEGTLFGSERLVEVLRANGHRPADDIRQAISDAVKNHRGDWPQEDDVTLVVIKCVDDSPAAR